MYKYTEAGCQRVVVFFNKWLSFLTNSHDSGVVHRGAKEIFIASYLS
jgi:hypothetical protein